MPIPIDAVRTPVVFKKPKVRVEWIWWPVLKMADWIKALIRYNPRIILAGHLLEEEIGWKHVFSSFWDIYKTIDPNHPVFNSGIALTNAIPYYIHGDEGRGLRSRPFLVESFQVVITQSGLFETSEQGYLEKSQRSSGFVDFTWCRMHMLHYACLCVIIHLRHSFTTRFLTNCISSKLCGPETLSTLHADFTEHAITLYQDGLEVPKLIWTSFDDWLVEPSWPHHPLAFQMKISSDLSRPQVNGHQLHMVCIGAKGDWKYLREAGVMCEFAINGVFVFKTFSTSSA